MDDPNQTGDTAEPAYMYKPSLMGAPWIMRLTPVALSWAVGRRSGQLPYREIARIRMSFRPVTMQAKRFITEIRAPGTPRITIASASWKNMVEQERQDKPYRDFIVELHRRVAAAGTQPSCEAGLHPVLYWPGVVLYGAVLFGLAILIVRALQVPSWPAVLFVSVFFVVFAWHLGQFFKLNKPARYEPDAPPRTLLPGE